MPHKGASSKVGTAGTSKWERSCDPLGTLRMPSGSRAYAHLDVPLGTLFPKWEQCSREAWADVPIGSALSPWPSEEEVYIHCMRM